MGVVEWVLLCAICMLFGTLIGLVAGYYRLAFHLAHEPNSRWWTFIKNKQEVK